MFYFSNLIAFHTITQKSKSNNNHLSFSKSIRVNQTFYLTFEERIKKNVLKIFNAANIESLGQKNINELKN